MDFKRRMSRPPAPPKMKYRLIEGHVFPDSIVVQSGRNPDDYEECGPPNAEDLERAVKRIRVLEGK